MLRQHKTRLRRCARSRTMLEKPPTLRRRQLLVARRLGLVDKLRAKPYFNSTSTLMSGRNSAVECQLPKLDVAGSTPVARSNFFERPRSFQCRPILFLANWGFEAGKRCFGNVFPIVLVFSITTAMSRRDLKRMWLVY